MIKMISVIDLEDFSMFMGKLDSDSDGVGVSRGDGECNSHGDGDHGDGDDQRYRHGGLQHVPG
jgi:hypothetical protein